LSLDSQHGSSFSSFSLHQIQILKTNISIHNKEIDQNEFFCYNNCRDPHEKFRRPVPALKCQINPDASRTDGTSCEAISVITWEKRPERNRQSPK